MNKLAHIAAQPEVIEEQVDVEVFAADFEMELTSDEGEARAKLEQEARDVCDECTFDLVVLWARKTFDSTAPSSSNDVQVA